MKMGVFRQTHPSFN